MASVTHGRPGRLRRRHASERSPTCWCRHPGPVHLALLGVSLVWAPTACGSGTLAYPRQLAGNGTQFCVAGHVLLRFSACFGPQRNNSYSSGTPRRRVQLRRCVPDGPAVWHRQRVNSPAWQRQLAKRSSGQTAAAPTWKAAWKDELLSHVLKHEIRSASPLNLSI